MDFKKKITLQFLKDLISKVKFSIRLSILSIVLILLMGVAILIVSINYYSVNSILIASARNSLVQSSGKISEKVDNYLHPLNHSILIAYRMFKEGVVDSKRKDFTKFLYSLIVDNKNLVAAYWGDEKGNLYWLNRSEKGFYEEIIKRDSGKIAKAVKKEFDLDGNVLETKSIDHASLDPRDRPWYKQAKDNKKPTWVVYRFVKIGDQESQLGVTSAFPVYDSKGKLEGVLGIDMLLGTISKYVRDIDLTEHSYIFIVDSIGNIISAYTEHEHKLVFDEVPDITDIKSSWVRKSFELYNKEKTSPLIYSSGGKNYITAYEKITNVKNKTPWFVAIVTPINDIIAPMRKSVLVGAILTCIALLIGIIMASIFSASLSSPIKKLARDSNLICKLQLENIKRLYSRIKEVDDMAGSFVKMKNALYSFQRYMPITLVKNLIISNKIATVGGESKELTLLFTDIEGFTSLCEDLAPEEVMQYLSEYFQNITKVIIEMGGTVDKYIGDGVMAFWGAPIDDSDHALHCCSAALKAKLVLSELNLKWKKEGKPAVHTRFGINSGNVIVGNVGSDDRLEYTSLGDPVNLASRLEMLNKLYHTSILVSEFIQKKLKDKFEFRLLDRVAVKGKRRGVYIYELVGEISSEPDLKLRQYNEYFAKAFASYKNGDWQNALFLFEELSRNYSEDFVAKIFISRISEFVKNPPESWDGVWVMEEK